MLRRVNPHFNPCFIVVDKEDRVVMFNNTWTFSLTDTLKRQFTIELQHRIVEREFSFDEVPQDVYNLIKEHIVKNKDGQYIYRDLDNVVKLSDSWEEVVSSFSSELRIMVIDSFKVMPIGTIEDTPSQLSLNSITRRFKEDVYELEEILVDEEYPEDEVLSFEDFDSTYDNDEDNNAFMYRMW